MAEDRLSVVRQPVYGQGGTFTYTGTAGNSSGLTGGISGVWVYCTTDAYVRLDSAAAAATTDWPIPSYQMVWIPVPDPLTTSSPVRLSAVQQSTGGSAFFIPGK